MEPALDEASLAAGSGILFRPARPEDAAELVGLVEELGYPSSPTHVAERLRRVLEREDQVVLVAADGARILGFVHALEFLTLASDPCALISALVVDRVARRRGVGRRLVDGAEAWARERGLSSMRLRSRVTRVEAHAFYRRLGYEPVKQQLQFRKAL